MERLTYRNSSGEAHAKCKEKCTDNEVCNPDICMNRKVLERLAQYEELEISPEQVREIDKAYAELCVELGKYKRLEKRLEKMFGGKLPLEKVVDDLEFALKEPGSPHPMNARILTYAESAEWEEYLKLKESLLPLELGNEIYFVDTEEKEIIPTSIIHIEKWLSSLSGDVKIVTKIGCVSELNGKCTVFFYPQDVGEKVFLTREMAEQVLNQLAEENKNVD